MPVALAAVVVLTVLIVTGIRQSSSANMVMVMITLFSLIFFVVAGAPLAVRRAPENFFAEFGDTSFGGARGVLHATALMFVAYTGYGRIATLGEEVKDPARTIPRAVIITLIASMVLYLGVASVGLATVGAAALGEAARRDVAPLPFIAAQSGVPGAETILTVGALTAMLGVLLNLLLGLSRTGLAMGRRGDLPTSVAAISPRTGNPTTASWFVACLIAGLILLRDLRLTWSFSAFSVLIYYAITNLCALQIETHQRRYPRWIAYSGLAACLVLAFWVDWHVWLVGCGLLLVGFVWHALARRRNRVT
jgi:APA family basic amino acid/polyamine antiporter